MTTIARSPLRLLEALATPHGVDRYLELLNPMFTVRELRGEVTQVRRVAPDTIALTVRPTRRWRGFSAGQFVQVTVVIDGVRRTRCYSPSNSQLRADGRIELTVKAHPGGLVSQWLHANARPGLVLDLAPADGTFTLPTTRPDRLLMISGGSGITPVLSMLRTLCDEQDRGGRRGEIVFLHYADDAEHVPHRAELERLAALHDNVRLALAYPADESSELTGFFGAAHLEALAPWHRDAQTFVCGPPGLMRAVREHYAAIGLLDRLHAEEFTPAVASMPGDATGTVRFAASDTSLDNTGAVLLEQAEAAGLRPEYGCRMGICFSCTQTKISGCTRNVRTGETDDDPDTEIQLCINVAVGDVELAI
ncbi:MAG TPA: FAD-binding oxidoreductase [Jatrophihabitans sp.]|jgi:ferredoxin-NADP reductase